MNMTATIITTDHSSYITPTLTRNHNSNSSSKYILRASQNEIASEGYPMSDSKMKPNESRPTKKRQSANKRRQTEGGEKRRVRVMQAKVVE